MRRIPLLSRILASVVVLVAMGLASPVQAQEFVLGTDVIEPGIEVVFEAAPEDDVTPHAQNLAASKTDVHLEMLAGWSTDPEVDVPEGVTRGGFVAYMNVFATITNETTGKTETITLIPHITLGDAMHYARNVSLPGATTDPYTITFDVQPPAETELAFHKSWRDAHGTPLFEAQTYTYEGVDLEAAAAATR